MNNNVLARSARLRFSAANDNTMGVADGSIIAAIITTHMAKTAPQLENDQAESGIVNCITGLAISIAPHNSSNQHATVAAPTATAVQGWVRISRGKARATCKSALVCKRSEEAVSPGDVARDTVFVDFEARCARDGHRLAGRYRKRVSLDLHGSTALAFNWLHFS